MKLQADRTQGPTITGYGEGWVAINGEASHHSMLLSSAGHRLPWNVASFDSLQASDFETLLSWDIELLLFGSGTRVQFPHPQWLPDVQLLGGRRPQSGGSVAGLARTVKGVVQGACGFQSKIRG